MDDLNKIMSKNLQRHRSWAGFTQEEAANALKITRATLSRWEKKPANVAIVKLAEICNLYGCTVNDLLKAD